MKIAIVGAGISGLSLYLFLRKHIVTLKEDDVVIYEAYQAPRRKSGQKSMYGQSLRDGASFIGAGLGIGVNGMRILRKLNPQLHDAVVAEGYPATQIQFKNSHNQTLGSMPTVDRSQQDVEYMVMTSRQGFWDCLRDVVPDEALSCGRAVERVTEVDDGRYVLEFKDGTKTGEYDMVVGADGVKSGIKKAVLGDGVKDDYPPKYKGLVGVGGFIPFDILRPTSGQTPQDAAYVPTVMTFGAEGFFGYAPSTSPPAPDQPQDTQADSKPYGPEAMWWSTYEEDLSEKKEIDNSMVRGQLQTRHAKWKDPVIQKIIHGNMDILSKIQTWVTPKLPTWVRGGLILIGDAAHALPSTSGQGASQALEDAQALSLLLSHHLSGIDQPQRNSNSTFTLKDAIRVSGEQFCTIRKPRVEAILDTSSRMSDQKKAKGVIGEWMTYFFMWGMLTFFPNMLNKSLMSYSVEKEVEKVVQQNSKG